MISSTRLLLLAVLAWCVTGPAAAEGERLKVVTTFTILADMASEVAGDAAEVVSVTKPGAEIHNYQPTPRDIARTRSADLILWNGLNLELWFEKFLQRLDGVPSVILSEGVEPMSINQGPYDGKPNPHAWMSPSDALIYVDNIEKALIEADPDNTAIYHDNAQAYRQKIRDLSEPLRQQIETIPENQRWLASSEGAFSYLARDFGLQEAFLWPINADSQGTPQQVRQLIDLIRAENIPAIFSESTVSSKPAEQVARETGAHYGGVLHVDSLSEADGPVPTYLDLIRVTMQTLVEGIEQGAERQQ